jgi:hypothetical protein
MGGNKNGSVATGVAARRSSGIKDDARRISPRTSSSSLRGANGVSPRRPSEGVVTSVGPRSPRLSNRRQSDLVNGNYSYRRESLGLPATSRRGSEDTRRMSNDTYDAEMDRRRLSEAGFRRQSQSNQDAVLNEDTQSLRVGQQVWVDGNKHGRIAFIGNVQFAKGEVAGVHLDKPYGKNNGSVGGVLYFQCEPKHGIFARLHRLTLEPLISEEDDHHHYH